MAIPLIGPLISAIASVGSTYLEGHNTKVKAKAEAKAKVMVHASQSIADWERIMAQNSATSWKDEWLTLLFSVPMILVFFPEMQVHVTAGFNALETMPDWYQYTLSVIVAASFGVRSAIGFMKAKK